MNTYDRHLLREWLQILGLVLVAMMGLLLMQVLYDDFRNLNDLGARRADFGVYFFVTLPGFLALVLPVALLISLLFVLGKLHRANEFTALRAAGVSLLRITAPGLGGRGGYLRPHLVSQRQRGALVGRGVAGTAGESAVSPAGEIDAGGPRRGGLQRGL